MVVTPDKRKLFVSYVQPAPHGTIEVFDISNNDYHQFQLVATINGVNCPEGLAVSSSGNRIYAASQCGLTQDSVFVIDTATNRVIDAIPGLAVGTDVAASPDGRHIFVSRGNYPCTLPASGAEGSPLSAIDLKSSTIVATICLCTSVGEVALSRDETSHYLVVANGKRLSVFDREKFATATPSLLNDIPLEAPILAFGISEDNGIYAYIPESHRLLLGSLKGLEHKSPELLRNSGC